MLLMQRIILGEHKIVPRPTYYVMKILRTTSPVNMPTLPTIPYPLLNNAVLDIDVNACYSFQLKDVPHGTILPSKLTVLPVFESRY
ncbi:uncharacterized protein ANIA_11470 [Aspergillus nidulans FGSC A4]|uniref:Uncharacterized protein n=1 Tax=Emericella nidulans (strain FGSC A4 / ATCC 38163 / CBS 112.46 / NRRL 194 / M139) TaxID=227321 RepID=C8VF94_EMENI|nr:hypothetical protein [Aspergillus nidulans FGSC A4]CBF81103.1 TPA: hypothetical protein ANIA_11470 [Aspergillus nidulans FGSC A4]